MLSIFLSFEMTIFSPEQYAFPKIKFDDNSQITKQLLTNNYALKQVVV